MTQLASVYPEGALMFRSSELPAGLRATRCLMKGR